MLQGIWIKYLLNNHDIDWVKSMTWKAGIGLIRSLASFYHIFTVFVETENLFLPGLVT